MSYQEVISKEIQSLPKDLLPEVLDFILFLKLKPRMQNEVLSEKARTSQFQKDLKALSQAYRQRLKKEGKLNQTTAEVMAELKQMREDIAANEYCK